jgi:DNA-binding IclR family transcriptional regulator
MNIVTKAGLLLSALSEHGEVRPASLSAELGEPMSSVYRLIANLETLGWVERGTKRGTVRLGLQFVKLGRSLESQLDVRQLARPHLEKLTRFTGQTAVLAIRRGYFAVCIERTEGGEVLTQSFRVGDSHALHKSAVSRAILAFESKPFLEGFLSTARAGTDPALGDVEPTLLGRQLREIVASRTSFSDSDINVGMAAIAAPIFNHRGEVLAGLSLTGLRGQILDSGEELIDAVLAEADEMSRALGHDVVDGGGALRGLGKQVEQ